jgi:glutathione synthase
MRPKAANLFSLDSLSFAPFMLLPSAFPRREFEKSLNLQPLVNELIHRVANNYEFLKKSLAVYEYYVSLLFLFSDIMTLDIFSFLEQLQLIPLQQHYLKSTQPSRKKEYHR